MIAGDDPTPWHLLHDGVLTAIVRTPTLARLTIDIPFVRRRMQPPGDAFVVELHGLESLVWLPYSDRWDEPEIDDLAAIVAAEPNVADAEFRDANMVVWSGLGSLRMVYAGLELALEDGRSVSIAELREAVASYWQEWREHWSGSEVHPLVHAATRETWTDDLLARLIEAWQTERTSDLATTIAIVDETLHPNSALAELVRSARASWDILLGTDNRYENFDERAKALHDHWEPLRRRVAALEGAPADPRIGRAMEGMLRGPSEAWFRVDQVHHAIDRFEPPPDQVGVPSFADHALALLELHGDAGSIDRLREKSRRLLIEADCNTAEMSERLARLADRLAEHWPRDRALPDTVEQTLRLLSGGTPVPPPGA
jgi:hypothetical protein